MEVESSSHSATPPLPSTPDLSSPFSPVGPSQVVANPPQCMPDSPTLSSFVLLGFDPACLGLFCVSALVHLTTFCPQLTADYCPLCVVFLHSMVVHGYFCAVFCKSSRKPFIKLSRTSVLQVDPTTPVSFTIIITVAVVAQSVGPRLRRGGFFMERVVVVGEGARTPSEHC